MIYGLRRPEASRRTAIVKSQSWQPELIMSDLPPDFAAALKHAGLTPFFADCTNAHRNEYLKWIAEAKRPETRQTRIEKAIKMLSQKSAEEAARTKKPT